MCDVELEPSDAWTETERTARKEHRCSACRGRIAAGSRYLVHFSKYEGAIITGKLCGDCRADRDTFCRSHYALTCTPSYFPTLLADCIADGDEESEQAWKPMLAAMQARAARSASARAPEEPRNG